MPTATPAPATVTATATAGPAVPTIKVPRIRNDYFPWRRFFIVLVGIMIELFVWRWAINHLYTLPPTSVAVFGSLTIATQYVIGFLVAYFVTGQAYFTNWSNVTTSAITAASEVKELFDSRKSKGKK